MEVEQKPSQQQLAQYQILRELGSGYTSEIMLGFDSLKQTYAALKILKQKHLLQTDKTLKAEVLTLRKLNHKNIIKVLGVQQDDYIRNDGSKENVTFIELEFAAGGTLFDYIKNRVFSEEVCRYYFHQLIDGLEHCHRKGFAHRDLKPENLLLDDDFQLKLADFGFSKAMLNQKLKSFLGTESYMAPEILLGMEYNGQSVDLFAAAIVLFIMYSGTPAFGKAVPNDPYYRLICTNKHNQFWRAHSRNKPGKLQYYSKSFKDLMNGMLSFDPVQRLSIADIKQLPWFKGPLPTKEQIIQEFSQRRRTIEQQHEVELNQKILAQQLLKAKEQIIEQMSGANTLITNNFEFRDPNQQLSRSEISLLSEQFPGWDNKRRTQKFVKIGSGLNFYKTHTLPKDVLSVLLLFLVNDKDCDNIQIDQNEYKISCNFKDEFGDIQIGIGITEIIQEKEYAVEFQKVSGQLIRFYDKIQKIKTKILSQLVKNIQIGG